MGVLTNCGLSLSSLSMSLTLSNCLEKASSPWEFALVSMAAGLPGALTGLFSASWVQTHLPSYLKVSNNDCYKCEYSSKSSTLKGETKPQVVKCLVTNLLLFCGLVFQGSCCGIFFFIDDTQCCPGGYSSAAHLGFKCPSLAGILQALPERKIEFAV